MHFELISLLEDEDLLVEETLKAVDTVIFNYREQPPPPSFKRLPTGNKRNTSDNIFSAKTFGC